MAGLVQARPGHPRLACGTADVDTLNKSGHDGTGFGSIISKIAKAQAGAASGSSITTNP
jgi:hypothetical protein